MSRVRTVTLLEKVLYPLYELRLKRELRGKKRPKHCLLYTSDAADE